MSTTLERLGVKLVALRLDLAALAASIEQLGPAASVVVIGRANSPALVSLQATGKKARAELALLRRQQREVRAAFLRAWEKWTEEADNVRSDMGFPNYLPWQADKWDYWLDPYFEALEAARKGSDEDQELKRLTHILENKASERGYVVTLIQQSYLPAEY